MCKSALISPCNQESRWKSGFLLIWITSIDLLTLWNVPALAAGIIKRPVTGVSSCSYYCACAAELAIFCHLFICSLKAVSEPDWAISAVFVPFLPSLHPTLLLWLSTLTGKQAVLSFELNFVEGCPEISLDSAKPLDGESLSPIFMSTVTWVIIFSSCFLCRKRHISGCLTWKGEQGKKNGMVWGVCWVYWCSLLICVFISDLRSSRTL